MYVYVCNEKRQIRKYLSCLRAQVGCYNNNLTKWDTPFGLTRLNPNKVPVWSSSAGYASFFANSVRLPVPSGI